MRTTEPSMGSVVSVMWGLIGEAILAEKDDKMSKCCIELEALFLFCVNTRKEKYKELAS